MTAPTNGPADTLALDREPGDAVVLKADHKVGIGGWLSWPFLYLWARSRWSRSRIQALRFDADALRVTVSTWLSSARCTVAIPWQTVQSVACHVGEEGGRYVPLALQLHFDAAGGHHSARLDFQVVDVDTRDKAFRLLFRLATAMGFPSYRVRHDDAERVDIELATGSPGGAYRAASDLQAVPDKVSVEFGPRAHGTYTAPELPRSFDPDSSGLSVRRWELGRCVIVGEPSKKWLLLLWPVAFIVGIAAWLFLLAAMGMAIGLGWVMVEIVCELAGITLTDPLSSDAFFNVLALISGLVTLGYALPILAWAMTVIFGRTITIDSEHDEVRETIFWSRHIGPLSHVDGFAVRDNRMFVQMRGRDLSIAGDRVALEGLANDLARTLDVPVSVGT